MQLTATPVTAINPGLRNAAAPSLAATPAAPAAPTADAPTAGIKRIHDILTGDAPITRPVQHPGIDNDQVSSADLFAAGTPLGDIVWDGEKLADVAQQQARFKVEGANHDHHVVGETAEATKLLETKGMQHALDGMLGSLDARKGAEMIKGITMSTTPHAFSLSRLMAGHDAGVWDLKKELLSVPDAERSGIVTDLLDQLNVDADNVLAQNLGWVVANTRSTGDLIQGLTNPEKATQYNVQSSLSTFAHELEHSITPAKGEELSSPDGNVAPINWIEEATAESLAVNKAAHEEFAGRLGVPANWTPTLAQEGYVDYHQTMDKLLGYAGITFDSSEGLEAARDLLQGAKLASTPARIADAIIAEQKLPAESAKELTKLVLNGGDAAGSRKVLSYLAQHAAKA